MRHSDRTGVENSYYRRRGKKEDDMVAGGSKIREMKLRSNVGSIIYDKNLGMAEIPNACRSTANASCCINNVSICGISSSAGGGGEDGGSVDVVVVSAGCETFFVFLSRPRCSFR